MNRLYRDIELVSSPWTFIIDEVADIKSRVMEITEALDTENSIKLFRKGLAGVLLFVALIVIWKTITIDNRHNK